MCNYFTFSLFSSNRANLSFYTKGAWLNHLIIKDKYPSFTARFYIQDDIQDDEYVKRLIESDSEVIFMENIYHDQRPVLWRFQPILDGDFDICFFRDCDSIITKREEILINKFLVSDCKYHVIRDKPHNNKILAGMWGIKETNIKMKKCINELYEMCGIYGFEEMHFEKTMWEFIRNDVLLHDYKLTPELFINNDDDSFIGKPFKIINKY